MRAVSLKPLLAGLVWMLAAGCQSPAPSIADDRATLNRIRQQIRDAERAGDASVFGQIAAVDIVVMPPGTAPITGRDAVVTAMRGFFANYRMEIDYAAEPVEVRGDIAIDRGTFTQEITAKAGGDPVPAGGSYLWVYRRTDDGRWQQSHAIWNVN